VHHVGSYNKDSFFLLSICLYASNNLKGTKPTYMKFVTGDSRL